MKNENRWKQRFSNYCKAYTKIEAVVLNKKIEELTEEGKESLIKRFEYTFELSWLTLKDYFENQGDTGISGSRDTFRLAFQRGLINNGEQWMEMIKSRQDTVHTYDEAAASEVVNDIYQIYFSLFTELKTRLENVSNK
jgi:nucleotidyltransferase substrate binding protein (TIGR01987 family)